MSANSKDRNFTPQATYHYVQGLLKVEGDEDEPQILQDAVGVCFNYLTQKRMEWGIYLEKLMELFLDLAFQTQKHSKIKQVLKSYRAVTQNQHPDSLKTILQYYRDEKLKQILDEQIPKDSLESIKQMKSVETEEASSEIIISSLSPEMKNKREMIRTNLKIVWEGYKTIIDTVRLNHKMEGVYRSTLKKIFEFVDQYNRKHEFKGFCDNQRKYGLKNILSKRGEKLDQQRNYYIDIEKEEVNTNNIEIRLEQFDLSTKLGLWQEAFQALEDIKEIMKVRKGPVKNALKCAYFEKLALIFKKSNYWHYHAFAFYNYFSIFITKSKLPVEQKMKVADKLILSVLCIPPSTLQRYQSKESQQKITSMMISSSKIPEKSELQQMMISKGVVENASPPIKELWYFMFLDFDLTSLAKGVKLLEAISKNGDYKEFIELLEEILIYKQLISVAQVYHRIKYQSLLSIIPFSKQKVQKVLLESHHRKVIDYVLDEKQGILIFEDKLEETNPYEEFLTCYVDVAILHEESRKYDIEFILKKANEFISTADEYYNSIRVYKIDQYKNKLRKPMQDLENKERERERKLQEQKRHQQILRKQKQAEQKKEEQEKNKLYIEKRVKIEEIINVKQNRNVKIGGKKVEHLTEEQIKSMDKMIFEEGLKQIKARVANQNEARNKKRFQKVDYIQRQRRLQLNNLTKQSFPTQDQEQQEFKKIIGFSRVEFEEKQKLKQEIEKIAPGVKGKIDQHFKSDKEKYETNMKNFKQNINDEFKKKILAKARQLREIQLQRKKQDELKRRTQQISRSSESSWSFGKNLTSTVSKDGASEWKRRDKTTGPTGESTTVQESETKQTSFKKQTNTSNETWGRKNLTGATTGNAFSALNVDDEEKKQTKKQKWFGTKVNQEKKQEATEERWGSKKVEVPTVTVPKDEKKEDKQTKFVPPPVQQTKGAWGTKGDAPVNQSQPQSKGAWGNKGNVANNPSTTASSTRQDPELTFKSKKDDKKPTKGKGW